MKTLPTFATNFGPIKVKTVLANRYLEAKLKLHEVIKTYREPNFSPEILYLASIALAQTAHAYIMYLEQNKNNENTS